MSLPNAAINGETRLPKGRDLHSRIVGKECMLRDILSGQVHFLNSTSSIVWKCCDGLTTTIECESRLRAIFAFPESVDLAADIQHIIADFKKRGLTHA